MFQKLGLFPPFSAVLPKKKLKKEEWESTKIDIGKDYFLSHIKREE